MKIQVKQFLFFIVGILLIFSSCKNPDSIIGLNVQPPSDKLGLSIDTVTLQTLTVAEDTLRADKVLNLVGSECSNVYGKTNVSVYSQVVFGTNPSFGAPGDALVADSIVLKLAYNGYYGDTTQQLTLHVYQLSSTMNVDSPYYNDQNFPYNATALKDTTFTPYPTTPDSEYGGALPPQLRIPLPTSLATSILAQNGQTALSSNDNWIQYFNGIYLKVDPINTPGHGCICYFNMGSLDSKMRLYFHDHSSSDTAQIYYDFQFTGARLNHQEHDYTGTDIATQLMTPTQGYDINYIHGAAGVKVKIKMPYISQFASKSNIAVNRAELIINRQATPTDTLAPPASLWLQIIDSTGHPAYIPDQFESAAFYGGTYNSGTSQYTFNITHYFQDVVKGKLTDHGMFLGVSGASVLEYYGVIEANHVAIVSGQSTQYPAQKMQLKLYYTKLN